VWEKEEISGYQANLVASTTTFLHNMPFRTVADLTKRVKSVGALPSAAKRMFLRVFNTSLSKFGEERALKVAWAAVKKRFKRKPDGTWVARSSSFGGVTYFTFEATPAEKFESRSEDGNILHNYVLTDNLPDKFGTSPSNELMQEWAVWINEATPEVDTDHNLWTNAVNTYGGDETEVAKVMQFKKGVAKAVKAFVDKGQLIVSLLFDKRYNKHIEKFSGLSIEAGVPPGETKWINGKLFGFSLMENDKPGNPRSRRL